MTGPERAKRGPMAYLRARREAHIDWLPLAAVAGVVAAIGRSWWSVASALALIVAVVGYDYRVWRRDDGGPVGPPC